MPTADRVEQHHGVEPDHRGRVGLALGTHPADQPDHEPQRAEARRDRDRAERLDHIDQPAEDRGDRGREPHEHRSVDRGGVAPPIPDEPGDVVGREVRRGADVRILAVATEDATVEGVAEHVARQQQREQQHDHVVRDRQHDDGARRHVTAFSRPQDEQEGQPRRDHRDEPDHDQDPVRQSVEEQQVGEDADGAVPLALRQHRMVRRARRRGDERDGAEGGDRSGDRAAAREPAVHRALQGLDARHVGPSLREPVRSVLRRARPRSPVRRR